MNFYPSFFYMSVQSHIPSFYQANHNLVRINNYEATHYVFFSMFLLPCYFMPQHFLEHPVLKHRQTVDFPKYDTLSFTRSHKQLTKFWCYKSYWLCSQLANGHTKCSAPNDTYAEFPPLNPSLISYRTQYPFPSALPTHLPFASTSPDLSPISMCSFCPPFCSPYNYFPPHSIRSVPRQTSFSKYNETNVFFTILLALSP